MLVMRSAGVGVAAPRAGVFLASRFDLSGSFFHGSLHSTVWTGVRLITSSIEKRTGTHSVHPPHITLVRVFNSSLSMVISAEDSKRLFASLLAGHRVFAWRLG